jgi:hypothetical protein
MCKNSLCFTVLEAVKAVFHYAGTVYVDIDVTILWHEFCGAVFNILSL